MIELCERVPGTTYLKTALYDLSRIAEMEVRACGSICAPHRWQVSRAHAADLELRAQWQARMGHRISATMLLEASRAEYARSAACAGVTT